MEDRYLDLKKGDCHKIFSLLNECMDDYLYMYDLKKDYYEINGAAAQRFNLSRAKFDDAIHTLAEVIHPEDYPALAEDLARIREGKQLVHDMEYRWLSADKQPVWINCRGQVVLNEQDEPCFLIGRITEIDKRGKIDNVTGLYREMNLKQKLAGYAAQPVKGYLLQIGIDNFKDINEKYGLSMGNEVLASLAECVRKAAKGVAEVYRMHGDEMVLLCVGYDDEKKDPAKEIYKKIRSLVDESIERGGFQIFHTISGGIVYFDEKDVLKDTLLLERAAFALHQAKLRGKNTCVHYTQEAYNTYVHRMDVQEYLRRDIKNGFRGFELYYQPIVYIEERRALGAEALLRWNSEQLGFMSPAEFIPLLEESGLIIPLGRWIIKTALQQCKEWQKVVPNFRISINLSFVQLKKSDAVRDIINMMDELNVSARDVLFEVTESGELEKENAVQVLRSFKSRLIDLAIDDFGTGYSNLRYVKDMTFDLVKIDQSFIRNIRHSQYDYLVVKQFTELAHTLNLKVCYEGVETKEDLECVLELKPDFIQGYYFSRPVPAGQFKQKFLNDHDVFG